MNPYRYSNSKPATNVDPSGLEGEENSEELECCGPDVTDWLIEQMNKNMNHPAITTARDVRWPRYVPFFNIGWTYGFISDFFDLVKTGGPWDFKSNEKFTTEDCPTDDCEGTVTICGICFWLEVTGNIHYGWVGRRAGLREWVLYAGGNWAAKGFSDSDEDQAAIAIGIEMADQGTPLCTLIRQKESQLSKKNTEGCNPCQTKYAGNPK